MNSFLLLGYLVGKQLNKLVNDPVKEMLEELVNV